MRISKCSILMSTCLALSACGSGQSDEVTTEADDSASYSIDQATGEAQMTITTDDGVATVRSGSNVPIDLPLGFGVYPGATVTSNSVVDHDGGEGSLIFFTSEDAPSDILEFYREQAETAGIEVAMDIAINDGGMLAGSSPDGASFTINANSADDGTSAQLMVADRLGQ